MQPSDCSMHSTSRGAGATLSAGWLLLVPALRLHPGPTASSSRAMTSGESVRGVTMERAEYRLRQRDCNVNPGRVPKPGIAMETLRGFPNLPALWLRQAKPAYADAAVAPAGRRGDSRIARPSTPTRLFAIEDGVRGKLIVLEGIDGSGTTTQLERAVAHLAARGHPAVATREPSPGPVGRLLREALLGKLRMPDGAPLDGRTMALLFAADRVDHVQREIEPNLAAGTSVVSDRYLLSSLAYQAEEADRAWVAALARGIPVPDLTILLDVPVEVAARRRAAAGRPVERYDADSYLAKVAGNYRQLAQGQAGVVVLDGTGSKDEVTAAVCGAITARFASAIGP